MEDLMIFAAELADAAGMLTMQYFRSDELGVDHKADDSPVTVADREAELLVRAKLRKAFPADGIVGEEHDDVPSTSGRTWYIDPIDGTKSFVHGVPLFTNLIACHDGDGPLLGVINTPALGEITFAARGEGCFHNGEPATVSTVADLSRSYVMTSGTEWWPEHLRPLANDAPFTLRTWGDGYGYSLVATGRAEAMLDPEASPWDLAPMAVILTEAGGRLTGVEGEEEFGCGSALASNGLIHDALLDVLAAHR